MEKKEEGDFVSQKVSYMIQAIEGALPKEKLKNIETLKTDAERFSFAWKLPEVHDVLVLEKEFETKSATLAKAHRETGNKYFQKKSYLTALGEYNLSVRRAPSKVRSAFAAATQSEDTVSDRAVNGVVEQPAAASDINENKGEQDGGETVSTGGESKPPAECKPSDGNVQNSEEEPKNELALAYANRSAALFHLKKFRECLEDIELAIQSGYPVETCYKLFERQGSCHIELGNQASAMASFTMAKDSLSLANLDEKAKNSWIRTLTKQLNRCSKELSPKSAADEKTDCSAIPQITGGPSTTHPNTSSVTRVQFNNVSGRHLTAGEDVKVGDVLVVDRPFASVLFSRFHTTHCYHCFVHISVPIPCMQCSSVVYCSRRCRDESWNNFHEFECQVFALLDISTCAKIGHLAIRLVMILGLENAIDYVKRRENEPVRPSLENVGKNSDGIYMSEYDSVYDMATNDNARPYEQFFGFTVVSCLLMKILQVSGYASLAEDSAEFSLLGGLLLRHLQIIQCNGLRIVEIQQPNRFDETKPDELGIGLYPTAALVNHSCDPTADLGFYGDAVVVRAIRNINQNEEITISYGPLFYETKELKRRDQLKAAYFFSCRCPPCKEHWPVIEEMFNDTPTYRCGNCRSTLTQEEKFERKFYLCSKCQYKQDMEEVVGQLQTSFDTYAKAMNEAMSGHSDEALPDFVQHLLLLQRYIRQPWQDFCSCQSAVKQCYRLQANKKL